MTLYGCPPPPRLSKKIGSRSALVVEVVMLIKGKSLGTETPLAMVVASGCRCPPLRICGLGASGLAPREVMPAATLSRRSGAPVLSAPGCDQVEGAEVCFGALDGRAPPSLTALGTVWDTVATDTGPPVQGESTSPGMTSDGAAVGWPGLAQPTARFSPPGPCLCNAST